MRNGFFCIFARWSDKLYYAQMNKMITILGPTATGKTALAAHVAYVVGGEIISGDSRQVYRGMDIGTGKDLADYVVNGKQIPYHLIDICDPGEKYNLFQYQEDFHKAYDSILSRGVVPILCGGTGLYMESVLRGYNLSPVPRNEPLRQKLEGKPLEELARILEDLKQKTGSVMHNKTDVDNQRRAIRAIEIEQYNIEHPVPLRHYDAVPSTVIGVSISRELRRQRITDRLRNRLDEGMVDEIRGLLSKGISPDDLMYYGLEYKWVTLYALGRISQEEMYASLEMAIHQFAKRQMTWFRGMERRGVKINWVDATLPMEKKVEEILKIAEKEDGR